MRHSWQFKGDIRKSRMSGRRMSGTSSPHLGAQGFAPSSPTFFLGKIAVRKCLGNHLEVPDILLPDIHDQPRQVRQGLVHAEGGATKGGVSKCEQMRANANKRRQTLTNASKRRGENASKRKQSKQTWTSANKRLHPPLLRFFTPPFAIPLDRAFQGGVARYCCYT